MTNYFTIDTINKILSKDEILEGMFGIEKEGIRVNKHGELSLKPHPEIFGNKLKNPYITTDFSESQVEIVTPTFKTIDETYKYLLFIVDIVNTNIANNEYIWNNSLPCILPTSNDIPIAIYCDEENGKKAYYYRKQLAKKYGTKKQMISGIHYNFSFTEKTIEKLYKNYPKKITKKEFKNKLYLKIVRNYLRYTWLIIYLTGCSVGVDKTFTNECIKMMNKEDKKGGYYSTEGVSFRNASCGYKNKDKLYPRYDDIDNFINDINNYIEDGILSEAKELYTQIRLKPKDKNNFLKSLKKDGIQYLELRTIDINPFDKCGISKIDMEFLHLFIIYLLIKDENNYTKWQEEGLYNEELISKAAYKDDTRLLKDGCEITIKKWAIDIISQIRQMNNILKLDKEDIIDKIQEKIEDPKKTYGQKLSQIYKNKGFIKSQITTAINNKQTSIDITNIDFIKNNAKLNEIYSKAIIQKKIKK